jgi:hypothetical protein
VKRLGWIAASAAGVALACLLLYKLMLASGLSGLRSLVR